jgi:hypothetical protein
LGQQFDIAKAAAGAYLFGDDLEIPTYLGAVRPARREFAEIGRFVKELFEFALGQDMPGIFNDVKIRGVTAHLAFIFVFNSQGLLGELRYGRVKIKQVKIVSFKERLKIHHSAQLDGGKAPDDIAAPP